MGAIINKTIKTDTKNPLIDPEKKYYSQDESTYHPESESECEVEPPMERDNNDTIADSKNPITQILDTLEQDGYDKLCNLHRTLPKNATSQNIQDGVINIIKSGSNEFEKKTGRPISYTEMRCAYG